MERTEGPGDGSDLVFEAPENDDVDVPTLGNRVSALWDELGEELMTLTGGREVRQAVEASRASVLGRDESVPRCVLEVVGAAMDGADVPECPGTHSVKIVVIGPFQSGTSSMVAALSDIPVLSTVRPAEADPSKKDEQRTVTLEFGRLTVSDDLMLYVYGTAGWQRTFFPWTTLADGMLGLVIVVDATVEASIREAANIKDYFDESSEVHYAIAANKVSPGDHSTLAMLRERLDVSDDVPVVACDVRERESVKPVLKALSRRILQAMP